MNCTPPKHIGGCIPRSGAHELCQPAPPSLPPGTPRTHHKLGAARDKDEQQQAVLERARVAHGLGRGGRGRLRVRVKGLPVAGALREHAHQRRRREAEHARDARVQRVGGRAQVARDHLRTCTKILCSCAAVPHQNIHRTRTSPLHSIMHHSMSSKQQCVWSATRVLAVQAHTHSVSSGKLAEHCSQSGAGPGRAMATMAWLFALHQEPSAMTTHRSRAYAHAHLSADPGTPVACADEAGMPCAACSPALSLRPLPWLRRARARCDAAAQGVQDNIYKTLMLTGRAIAGCCCIGAPLDIHQHICERAYWADKGKVMQPASC